jgi:hypothetical protein
MEGSLKKQIEIAKNFATSQTNNMIQRGETVQKNQIQTAQ